MKALVWILGAGGREAALAEALSRSPSVKGVVVLPGNAGLEWLGIPCEPAALETLSDFEAIGKRACEAGVDLIVVGPDDPIAAGCGDVLRAMGLTVFSPSREAAQLEASKRFAKECMQKAAIPTAFAEYVTDFEFGVKRIQTHFSNPDANPLVLKADGLARGKGVSVCTDLHMAQSEWKRIFAFEKRALIEEWVSGVELSQMVLTNGETFQFLPSAQDTKRLSPEPQSPNTGGMGAISPVEWAETPEFQARLKREVFDPILRYMREQDMPFQGCLYAGLMVNRQTGKFWVLEFNARFGDPETQVILDRITSDLYLSLRACAKGEPLPTSAIETRPGSSVVVVGTTERYPESSGPKAPIEMECDRESARDRVRFAGVSREGERLIASGGRVLGVLGRGQTPALASQDADELFQKILWKGLNRRFDIGSEPLVVLASGRGGNFQAIVEAVEAGQLRSARVVALGVDREDAGACERAMRLGIPTGVFPGFLKDKEERLRAETALAQWIRSLGVRTVVLAGFRWKLGASFLKTFLDENLNRFRVINIHPSLLPKYPGLNAYRKAFEAGERETGITVHWVDEGLDTGDVIAQRSFSIEDLKSVEECESRGLALEYAWFPEVLEQIFSR